MEICEAAGGPAQLEQSGGGDLNNARRRASAGTQKEGSNCSERSAGPVCGREEDVWRAARGGGAAGNLWKQVALAEAGNKISSRALLSAGRSQHFAHQRRESTRNKTPAAAAPSKFLPLPDSPNARLFGPRGGTNFEGTGEKTSASLEEVLREASAVRGIQLGWLFYVMISFLVLVFSLLFAQVRFAMQEERVSSEKRAVSISAATAVNQVEWLYYGVNNVMRIFESSRGLAQNLSVVNETLKQLCKSVGGAPLMFAAYKNSDAALKEFYLCPLAISKGFEPPLFLKKYIDIPLSELPRMAVYRSDFIIASLSSTNNAELLVVFLHKELVGHLLFANSNLIYSTSLLKHSTTAILLPDFFTSKLVVVVLNSPQHKYVNESLSRTTQQQSPELSPPPGLGLQSIFENICASGKTYTWNIVMRSTYNESYIWKHDVNQSYNNMPAFYTKKENFMGDISQVVMCGVVCHVPLGNYCLPDNPTNRWFVVNNEPLGEKTDVAFSALKVITFVVVILFFLMAAIVYVSVSIPVQHLKLLIFETVGDKQAELFCNTFFFRYTRNYWLGEIQALIRIFQLLCFCFRLNKKYVPQHVLEQQVLALQTRKDYVWRTIVEKLDTGDTDIEEGDDDGAANEQEVMKAFVNTVSAVDNKVPDINMLRVSRALLRRESSVYSIAHSEGEIGEGNAPFATEQSTTDLGRHRMTLVEGATILAVHLCAVEMAYFTNYHVALKQHRRIMNYLLERIRRYRGELFERSGDCIAAAWNAFENCVDHASAAASCALSIARLLTPYRQAGFRVGIVLHQGPFVCGVVEDNKEAFTTVFGTVPRQAIALAELAASLPCFYVLVSEPVKQSLASLFECIIVDVIKFHENDNPIVMFELNEERRLVSAKGTPLTPSAFAEEHAKVFFDFRNHCFEEALAGVEQLKSRFPNSGSQLLKRLELLCNFYMHRKHELPMPYFRPYPMWLNYEAIASADDVVDMHVDDMKGLFILDSLRLARTKSIYEDDTAKFRRDLHDSVLASKRTQNTAFSAPALDDKTLGATRSKAKMLPMPRFSASPARTVTLSALSTGAKVRDGAPGTPAAADKTKSPSLRRARSELLISAAGKRAGGGGGGGGGGVEGNRHASLCSATSTRTVAADDDDGVDSLDLSGCECSPFAGTLQPALFNNRAPKFFSGNDSFISLNSGILPNFSSFCEVEKSFAEVVNEFPQKILAKNGIEYIRSSRILGKGSFGCVYLGMEALSGRFVAIKFLPLPSDEEEIAKVESEVVTMQKVKSNHVVEFISYAFVNNLIVIFMECMMAGSLQGLMSGFGKFHSATARLFIRDVLRGLHRLHSKGIIHRDVKPQNVLHSLAGSCKISDFGASAFLQELVRRQMEGKGLQVQGTPAYLAPEAARGKPEEKSDIWSCGVMFIQLVTNRLPYAEEFLQMPPQILVYQIGSGAAKPIIPDFLDEFDTEFVKSCLRDDPKLRLSAKELLELPLFGL